MFVNDADQHVVEAATSNLTHTGGKAIGVATEVGTTELAERLDGAAVKHPGRLNALVSHAGNLRDRAPWEIPTVVPALKGTKPTGTPLQSWTRRDERLATVQDAAGLVSFSAPELSVGITGQAIGMGENRPALRSHPQRKTITFHDSSWSGTNIATAWAASMGPEYETCDIPVPGLQCTNGMSARIDLDHVEATDLRQRAAATSQTGRPSLTSRHFPPQLSSPHRARSGWKESDTSPPYRSTLRSRKAEYSYAQSRHRVLDSATRPQVTP
ncbi:hypothetical protein ACIPSE_44435 [Streptomyces sp. NPDC090106]|uniref:hypothetical protein n=1 Tax=Streptomyces sp. NPDC090106 TaxID=3365946 RepID=UPI00380ADEE5